MFLRLLKMNAFYSFLQKDKTFSIYNDVVKTVYPFQIGLLLTSIFFGLFFDNSIISNVFSLISLSLFFISLGKHLDFWENLLKMPRIYKFEGYFLFDGFNPSRIDSYYPSVWVLLTVLLHGFLIFNYVYTAMVFFILWILMLIISNKRWENESVLFFDI